MDSLLEGLKYDAAGLIPAIVQDWRTGEVLMMAWMNREAVEKTAATGKTHFYSRSRGRQWMKGESSGHVQNVKSIATDCDQDVLLVKVEQVGAACHDGYYSCFYREHPGPAGAGEGGPIGPPGHSSVSPTLIPVPSLKTKQPRRMPRLQWFK